MPDAKFKPGNEAFDLIVDLRSNLRDPGGDAREFWGEDIYKSMVSDAKAAVERTWDNKDAAAFLSAGGSTRQAMRDALASGNYDAAFKSIPPLPYRDVHDPKAVYHQKPIATGGTQIEADTPQGAKASKRQAAPASQDKPIATVTEKAKQVFTTVREAAAAYRDKLIAASPEPQRAQSESHRQHNAMRQR